MGISVWQLVIILIIVVLLFGTKRLRSLGGDLGGAMKSFRSAVKDEDAEKAPAPLEDARGEVIDGEKVTTEKTESQDKS